MPGAPGGAVRVRVHEVGYRHREAHHPVGVFEHEHAAVAAVELLRYVLRRRHGPLRRVPRLAELVLRLVAGVTHQVGLGCRVGGLRRQDVMMHAAHARPGRQGAARTWHMRSTPPSESMYRTSRFLTSMTASTQCISCSDSPVSHCEPTSTGNTGRSPGAPARRSGRTSGRCSPASSQSSTYGGGASMGVSEPLQRDRLSARCIGSAWRAPGDRLVVVLVLVSVQLVVEEGAVEVHTRLAPILGQLPAKQQRQVKVDHLQVAGVDSLDTGAHNRACRECCWPARTSSLSQMPSRRHAMFLREMSSSPKPGMPHGVSVTHNTAEVKRRHSDRAARL